MIRRLRALALLTGLLLAAPPAEAAGKCTIHYEELPVTTTGLKPEIEATVNGQKVRFVLDSGAFYSIITSGTAAALGLRLRAAPYGLTLEAAGGKVNPSIVTVENLEVAQATLHRIEFLTGGGETGDGTAGVIGQNLLLGDVEYDLANGVVRLVRPQDCKGDPVYWDTKNGYQAIDLVRFDGAALLTTAYVEVNGQKFKAMFDTGAGVSYLTLAAAKRLGFDPNAPGVTEAGTSQGFGRRPFRTWIMPVDSFKIGGEDVRHTKLRVGDMTIADIDMLIGPDFFLSHHLYVANKRERIYFTYNGGPVFDLSVKTDSPAAAQVAAAPPPPSQGRSLFAAEPTDAEGYARRGAALLERKDYAGAIADLTKAHDLAPGEAAWPMRRTASPSWPWPISTPR
jgi:predicted aspartyl protease